MGIRRIVLVAVALTAALAPSAHAEEPRVTGYNNGDDGVIGITWGALPGARTTGDGSVDARCEFHQQQAPGSNWAIVVVEGHAEAGVKNGDVAASVRVECFLYDHATGALIFSGVEATAGVAAAWLPPKWTVVAAPHAYRICTKTRVQWRTGPVTENTVPACYNPSLVPPPPPI